MEKRKDIYKPIYGKELKEIISTVDDDAMVVIPFWNGYADTYAIVDNVYTDWCYNDIYNDFYGTDGKMDKRLFLKASNGDGVFSKPVVYIGTLFSRCVSNENTDTSYEDPNTPLIYLNGEEGDHELFFKLNNFVKVKKGIWKYISTEEDANDEYNPTEGSFQIEYDITKEKVIITHNDTHFEGKCRGILDFGKVLEVCGIHKRFWM